MVKLTHKRISKKYLVIFQLLIIIIVGVTILGGVARASEVAESHEVAEAQGEHAVTEEHTVAEGHGEEAAHEEHATEHEEPWWRFPGWEVAFAALASAFFLLLMRWLPLILEDKSGGPA